MRFLLSDTARARRLARLLQRELAALGRPAGLSACLDTAARLYGYASLVDLKASLVPVGSPFDEAAGPEIAAARRARHLAVLQGIGLDAGTAATILDRIRPTGRGRIRSAHDAVLAHLLARAVREGVSDLDVAPQGEGYAVRFTRLFERRLVHTGSRGEYEAVLLQLKDRARMDLRETQLGRDGGFQIAHDGAWVDLRVATLPTAGGERAIVRILDPNRGRPRLDQLGILRVPEWRRGLARKNGLCLIGGTPGSGRATTLNASVRELDRFGKKIYAAEDHHVGDRIPFVGQVSTDAAVGYGFAQAIRDFMRADPDVMILGEIRDEDTARNALRAASDHLVVATLHTGNIPSAVSRLRDLGVAPDALRPILRAVLVQTFVKVVCTTCAGHGREETGPCPSCDGTGYAGRTLLSECASFATADDVGRLVARVEDWRIPVQTPVPWPEMVDEGIAKMRAGITTSDEMRRVFGSLFAERCAALGLDPAAYALARSRDALRPG